MSSSQLISRFTFIAKLSWAMTAFFFFVQSALSFYYIPNLSVPFVFHCQVIDLRNLLELGSSFFSILRVSQSHDLISSICSESKLLTTKSVRIFFLQEFVPPALKPMTEMVSLLA
jgi:hypothetical protein